MLAGRIRTLGTGLMLIMTMVLIAGAAHAVEKGKTSYTAEAVCAFRSIGALDPDPKTRNPDTLAGKFVNPEWMHRFPGLGMDFEDAKLVMDNMNNGVFYYVNARTLHMDAMLSESLKRGVRQVVIMGAGFDSRAYRFHEAYPKVRFFEIDLPATSADKQQRVEKIMGKRPDWVSFVPIDFNTQSLDEVLGKAGFATDQKTFYVWEGVTYFISKAGVDNTLRFIAENSAPGSRVVFDYMLEDVVRGLDYSAFGSRRVVFAVALRGEPYVLGIAPRRLETFVNLRGLSLLSDLGPTDLSQRYLIGSNGKLSGKMAEFLRIVHAEVPANPERQRLSQQAEKQIARFASEKPSASKYTQPKVPADVQAFFDDYSNRVVQKDFDALADHFSDNYLSRGRKKTAVLYSIKRIYGSRPIDQFKIVLTQFDSDGDRAKIDGYIQRKGYRTPLMGLDIVKEADDRWRWYGNQQ